MAKNIFVNNSGSYQPISASYDDNSALSSSIKLALSASSIVGQTGLMQIYNKQLIAVPTSSVLHAPEGGIYSGTVLAYYADEGYGPYRTETPGFSGDIDGDLVTKGVKVRNISNAESGTLSSLYGGTSTTSYTSGSLITTSGSGPVFDGSDKVVAVIDNNGTWGLADKSILNPPEPVLSSPIIYLYTGSYTSNTILPWTKPAGCRYVRVIVQGGGGGGSAGGRSSTTTQAAGGCGGSGGGTCDLIINAKNIPNTVIITAGSGGQSGVAAYAAASSGGNSSFGSYIVSNGGAAGVWGMTSQTSTAGYSFGSAGGAPQGTSVGLLSYLAGCGGGAGGSGVGNNGGTGGGNVLVPVCQGGTGISLTSTVRGAVDASPTTETYLMIGQCYINNSTNLSEIPKLICNGGGGGGGSRTTLSYTAGSGSSPSFGSGGGGGGGAFIGSGANALHGSGGNGGKGYVLIICY